MAGGTQNRDAKIALEIHKSVIGTTKMCGCPIHRVNGKKTEIDATLFNRQNSSKDGLQSKCSKGGTFGDSVKHKLNAWKIIFIHDMIIGSSYLVNMMKKASEKTRFFYTKSLEIFQNEFNKLNSIENDAIKYFTFMSNINEMVRNGSLTNEIKLYNSNIKEEDCNVIIRDMDPNTVLNKEEIKSVLYLQDKYCNIYNLHCMESSDKTLHHHSNFRTDLGKVGYIYNEDGNPFKINGIHLRLNKFNTFKFTSNDSRVEYYFPDGDYKLANSEMKKINKNKLSGDHIWPISLGGKHDISNIEPMPLLDNIKKRNNLSVELVLRTKDNIEQYLTKRYVKTYRQVCDGKEITNELVMELERELKYDIDIWRESIQLLDDISKKEYILNLLVEHNMSIKKCDKIIELF